MSTDNLQPPWSEMLLECRQRFGDAPRDFGDAEKQHLRVAFSLITRIVSRSDGLCQPLSAQRNIFRDGVVVWGHLIQANGGLFEFGQRDLPGEMVYSLRVPDFDPAKLEKVATELVALKGKQPTSPALLEIADYLTDEMIRVFGLKVPKTISQEACLISTVQFVRHHLPNQMLSDSVLPIVVAPQPSHYAFVLPAVYWPDQLLRHWGVARPLIG
ncbi:hypothetical protein [Neorhodopirellula lusitana]|nr:hypothetical protein [Neorhodopirellula lusitana]